MKYLEQSEQALMEMACCSQEDARRSLEEMRRQVHRPTEILGGAQAVSFEISNERHPE